MSGGGGEQAIVMAAAAAMGRFYDFPSSCIAGATDSKLPDAQSGQEKALTVALAAHAGCNMITQAAGMHASLCGCALESYIIDNDMIGAVRSSLRGFEMDNNSLSIDAMEESILGDGHFLGAPDTLRRMKTDFVYPWVSDRASPDDWARSGGSDIRDRAIVRTRALLASHFPRYIDGEVDAALREQFDILLPKNAMQGPRA